MLYLMSEMSLPKAEYKVTYGDRIYGWKSLYVMATCEKEAMAEVVLHLGYRPDGIQACLAPPDQDR